MVTGETNSNAQKSVSAVADTVKSARRAQAEFERNGSQDLFDRAAHAAAWALMEPTRNAELSELAVETTGLGNVADKIAKNHRKTLGLLRDLKGAATFGVINRDAARGLTEIARPIGVIGAVVPSTNPVATPVNNAVNALKCGNAIVLSPSPRGVTVCRKLVEYIHAEMARAGLDTGLVQMVPGPSSKDKTQALMEMADLVIVTGSQDNVRRAYRSGTPAIGVGAGNATVIVDESADLADAAGKIAASKCFDNATSCSSENALVVVDPVYEAFIDALTCEGGRLLTGQNAEKLKSTLFQDGGLNRHLIARDIGEIIKLSGISVPDAAGAQFLVLEGEGVGPGYPESGEKLSRVVTVYRVADFAAGKALAEEILRYQGAGHSVGLHSHAPERAIELGMELPVCRVIVNQAHCFATGGSFDNALPFSLSMGCGSWGGNSINDNLNFRHFLNVTRVVETIPAEEPSLEDIFSDYWRDIGRGV